MENQQEWQVEQILQRGRINNIKHYLVKWKGYPLDEATWEPITNLDNCQHQILKFQEAITSHKKPRRSTPRENLEAKQIFRRKRSESKRTNQLCLPKYKDQESKMPQKKDSGESAEKMIELIATVKTKMNLEDEVEAKEANLIIKEITTEQINIKSIEPEKTKKQIQESNDCQLKIKAPEKEQPQYLQLFSVKFPQNQEIINKQQVIKISPEETNSRLTDELRVNVKNQDQTSPIKQRLIKKKEKKRKTKSKKSKKQQKQLKQQLGLLKEENCFQPQQTQQLPQAVIKQQDKDVNSKEEQNIENISQVKDSAPLLSMAQVQINDPENLISLLSQERDIYCDRSFQAFQRNVLLNIAHQNSNFLSSSSGLFLDLHNSPELLEELGSVAILRHQNIDTAVKMFVRVRHGWIAVGRTEQGLVLVPVSKLSESSWTAATKDHGNV